MKLNIKHMNYDNAKIISRWIYPEPYSIYSMDESDSCINELLNNDYFSVSDCEDNLVGYYCFCESAQVPAGKQLGTYDNKNITDIGLGMKPNLCGKGLGFDFLCNCLKFARNQLSAKGFRLTVAAFNERAVKVYEKAGFKKINSFERISDAGKVEFLVMTNFEEECN